MDKFKTIAVGGLPHTLNDFRQFLGRLDVPSEGIYQAFNNILGGFGTDFIVQGCVVSGSTGAFNITEGWILLSGELIKVDAQGPFDEAVDGTFTKVTTFDSRGTKTFLNGSINETYEKNRGVISGLVGTLDFDGNTFSDLRTIGVKSTVDTPIFKEIIEIGNWDMDTSGSVTISLGAISINKIRNISVMIFNDELITSPDFTTTPIERAGFIGLATQDPGPDLQLTRDSSGFFDSSIYNNGGINRGFVTIDFEK